MEKSELEMFFDEFIADLKNSSNVEAEEAKEEQRDESFFSLLPDELQSAASQDDTETSTSLDHNSQNPTATADQHQSELSVQESVPRSIPVTPAVQDATFVPQIVNIFSSVNLGCELDLNFIAANGRNVQYNRAKFKALFMRIRNPRTTASIYTKGTLICTGAITEEQSKRAARKHARILQKLGFPVRFLNFKIHNMVAFCKTFPICLERMALYHHCSYEPEIFPGLFYNVMPGVSMVIFTSGKITMSGIKTEADMHRAFEIAYPVLSWFRR